MFVVYNVTLLWQSTKEVKMICPRRFAVDGTENSERSVAAELCSEGGVVAEMCSFQTGL